MKNVCYGCRLVKGLTVKRLFKSVLARYGITKDYMNSWSLRSHQPSIKAQQVSYFNGNFDKNNMRVSDTGLIKVCVNGGLRVAKIIKEK